MLTCRVTLRFILVHMNGKNIVISLPFYVLFSLTGSNANKAVLHSADGRNRLSLDRIDAELTSSELSSYGN